VPACGALSCPSTGFLVTLCSLIPLYPGEQKIEMSESAATYLYDPKEDLLMYRKIHARRAECELNMAARTEILKMKMDAGRSGVVWEDLACRVFITALFAGLMMQYHLYVRLTNVFNSSSINS
jgi:hypothetical protein